MKNNRHHWTAGCLSGFALVLFLAGCEAKKSEPLSQAPEEQSQAMRGEPEKGDGTTLPAPEIEKSQPEAAKQQRKSGSAG